MHGPGDRGAVHDGDRLALNGNVPQLIQPLSGQLILTEDIHDMSHRQGGILGGELLARCHHLIADLDLSADAGQCDQDAILPHGIDIALCMVAHQNPLKIAYIVQSGSFHDILSHKAHAACTVCICTSLDLCDLFVDHAVNRMLHYLNSLALIQ